MVSGTQGLAPIIPNFNGELFDHELSTRDHGI